jgi:hypothetical protein
MERGALEVSCGGVETKRRELTPFIADCKFTHPASRPIPRAKTAGGKQAPMGNGAIAGNGMSVSKKFGVVPEKKLDPTAGEFKPAAAGV